MNINIQVDKSIFSSSPRAVAGSSALANGPPVGSSNMTVGGGSQLRANVPSNLAAISSVNGGGGGFMHQSMQSLNSPM